MTITIADSLIILATLLSPVIAIQVQKFIEQARERRSSQQQVFYDLMATRATRVAPKHVEALNRIDITFDKNKGRLERTVLDKWRIYADHLNFDLTGASEVAVAQWNIRGDDLFTDLLEALSAALNHTFDRVQLKRGIYYPIAHDRAEKRREVFEHALIRLLVGDTSLNMKVTEFPTDPDAFDLQKSAYKAAVEAMRDGVLNVRRSDLPSEK